MWCTRGFILFLAFLSSTSGSYMKAERRRWIPIKSCDSQSEYPGYECGRAYDGVITTGNGWSHKWKGGEVLPQWATFQLEEASVVNRVALKFSWADDLYRTKAFKIELNKGGSWFSPQNVEVVGASYLEARIEGSLVTLDKSREEVDVAFKRELGITEVRITVTENFENQFVITEVLIQNVPEPRKCTTVGGTQRGRQCIFPFVNPYTKAVHHACTSDFGLPPWCATRVNSDGTMTNYNFFGFCDETCEVEDLHTCYTMWSETGEFNYLNTKNKERRNCIFPFQQGGVWHNECDENSNGIPSCATAVDSNGAILDSGYCGPECPGSTVASQCIAATDSSTSKGSRCVFPGHKSGTYYLNCVLKNNVNVCPTSVNMIGTSADQWGTCGEEGSCDEKECITVGGAKSGEACRFPFRNPWTNELHFNCTTASLEQSVGNDNVYASAPWCATDTTPDDEMITGKWGFCSKKCPMEKQNNCYVDEGQYMSQMKRCIFPFTYNGLSYKQCAYIKGSLKCPISVDKSGLATEANMRRCGPSASCFDGTTINGNSITVGYVDVGSYTNDGSKILSIAFTFETGVEDSSESNWNVEASVTAGFEAFGGAASFEASATAGGGGGSASASSSHQTHALTYNCPAHTRVVLSQKVLKSGRFESRTFKLILQETKLGSSRAETPTVRELTRKEIAENIKSKRV